jgi:hypothetical protein
VNLDADEAFSTRTPRRSSARCAAQDLMDPSQAWGGGYPSRGAVRHRLVPDQLQHRFQHADRHAGQAVVLVIDGQRAHPGPRVRPGVHAHARRHAAKHPLNGPHDHTADKLDPATGGTATLDMNAGATVYGAVVVQGKIDKANGTARSSTAVTSSRTSPGSIRPRLPTSPARGPTG